MEAEQKLKEAEEINRRLKQKLLEETQKRKQGDIKHKEDEVQNDKPKNEKENVKGNIVIEFLVNPDQKVNHRRFLIMMMIGEILIAKSIDI